MAAQQAADRRAFLAARTKPNLHFAAVVASGSPAASPTPSPPGSPQPQRQAGASWAAYDRHRAESARLAQERTELLVRVSRASNKGSHHEARVLAGEATELARRKRVSDDLAAAEAVAHHCGMEKAAPVCIDLHGMRVAESEHAVIAALEAHAEQRRRWASAGGGRPYPHRALSVITGRGLHSAGGLAGARLRPAIKALLASRGERFTERQEGCFQVAL